MTSSVLALILLAFVLGLDSLRIGIPIGALRPSRRQQVKIALSFGFFESLTPIVGLHAGGFLLEIVEPWSQLAGATVLAACGVFVTVQAVRKRNPEGVLESRIVLVGLPASLSLDNLLASLGLGLLGVPVVPAVIVIGAISGSMCLLGLWLGKQVASRIPARTDVVSGLLLIVFAALAAFLGA